ncbi:MAG: hypothetical protein ACLP8S_08335 [Solirubrobacteraceae bacterium]
MLKRTAEPVELGDDELVADALGDLSLPDTQRPSRVAANRGCRDLPA